LLLFDGFSGEWLAEVAETGTTQHLREHVGEVERLDAGDVLADEITEVPLAGDEADDGHRAVRLASLDSDCKYLTSAGGENDSFAKTLCLVVCRSSRPCEIFCTDIRGHLLGAREP